MNVIFYFIFVFSESLTSFLLFWPDDSLSGLLRHAQGSAKWQVWCSQCSLTAECVWVCVCLCIWVCVPLFEVEQQSNIRQFVTSVIWRHLLVEFSSVTKDHTQRTNIHLCWVKCVRFPPSFFSSSFKVFTSGWNLVLALCSWLLGFLLEQSQSPMRTSAGGRWTRRELIGPRWFVKEDFLT